MAIHRNMPFAEYHAIKALSSHGAGKLTLCPATYWIESDIVRGAFTRGTALHAACLEPAAFVKTYAEPPRGNYTKLLKNCGVKEYWDLHKESCEARGVPILTDTQWDEVQGMRKSIWAHSEATSILGDASEVELSLTWDMAGVPCKTRVDIYTHGSAVADIKTARPPGARKEEAGKLLDLHGWARQAAFNRAGLQANHLDALAHYLIVVETEAPHVVGVFAMKEGGPDCPIVYGWNQMLEAIDLYRRCVKLDKWPAAYEFDPETLEPIRQEVGMNAWAMKKRKGLGFSEGDIPW